MFATSINMDLKKKYIFNIFTVVICILCFTYLYRSTENLNLNLDLLINSNWLYLILSIFLIYIGNLLSSLRFKFLLQHEGYVINFKLIHKINIYSILSSIFFFNFIGHSITRVKMLSNSPVPRHTIITITVTERIIGLITLIILGGTLTILTETAWLIKFINHNHFFLNYIIGGLWLLVSICLLLNKDQIIFFKIPRTIFFYKHILFAIFLTIVSYSCMVAAYTTIALALINDLNIIAFMQKTPLVMLSASLPISINGWGIRELAAVTLFTKINIPTSVALMISVLIGLLSIITTSISAIYQFYVNKQPNPLAVINNINHLTTINNNNSITNMLLNYFYVSFPLGFFILFKFSFNQISISVTLLDFISIFFAIIFISTQKIFNTKLFFIFCISSIILTISLIIGYVNFGSNSWAYANKFIGWFVLWSYALSGMYIAKKDQALNPILNQNIYSLKLFVVAGISILIYEVFLRYIEIITSSAVFGESRHTISGFSCNRNIFAYMLCMIFAALIAYGTYWLRNFKLFITYGFILSGIIVTGSRTGIITAIALCIISWSLNYISLVQVSSLVIICVCFVYLPLFINYISFYLIKPINLISLYNNQSSITERWRTITEGLQMWLNNPIFGNGLGAYIQKEITENNHPLIIHNTYVWLLAEFGLIGFITYVFMIIIIYKKIILLYKNQITKNHGMFLLLLSSTFLLFTLAHEMLYQRAHWFLIAYILYLTKDLTKDISTRRVY